MHLVQNGTDSIKVTGPLVTPSPVPLARRSRPLARVALCCPRQTQSCTSHILASWVGAWVGGLVENFAPLLNSRSRTVSSIDNAASQWRCFFLPIISVPVAGLHCRIVALSFGFVALVWDGSEAPCRRWLAFSPVLLSVPVLIVRVPYSRTLTPRRQNVIHTLDSNS